MKSRIFGMENFKFEYFIYSLSIRIIIVIFVFESFYNSCNNWSFWSNLFLMLIDTETLYLVALRASIGLAWIIVTIMCFTVTGVRIHTFIQKRRCVLYHMPYVERGPQWTICFWYAMTQDICKYQFFFEFQSKIKILQVHTEYQDKNGNTCISIKTTKKRSN